MLRRRRAGEPRRLEAAPRLGGAALYVTGTARALPAYVQRPVLVVVWSGNNLGLPRRLPVLLIVAFAALGTAKT